MSKEFIKENEIAKVKYSNQYECLADKSKETREFLKSTPCKTAKVPGEFFIARRSKRGMIYVIFYCNNYNIEYEIGDREKELILSDSEISELFNPSIAKACELIRRGKDRLDMSQRDLKKIYKNATARARNIEELNNYDMGKFYIDFLPNFLISDACRTKVFITPNLRSKIGV